MSSYPREPPSAYLGGSPAYGEKGPAYDDKTGSPSTEHGPEYDIQEGEPRALSRSLKGRHMQMIAIGMQRGES